MKPEPAQNTEPIKIDYSKATTFHSCPRKFYLSHVRGITSTKGSTALRFGSAFHAGMEGYYSHIAQHGWTKDGKSIEQCINFAKKDFDKNSEGKEYYDDYRSFPNLTNLLIQYIDHFSNDELFLKVRHTERAFKLLMKPTAWDRQYFPGIQPFYFTGKIDQECNLNGMDWLNEFKTTGWSLQALQSELTRSPQVLGYQYASRIVCNTVPEGVLVTIAYCKSTKSKTTGNYGKLYTDFARFPQIYNDHDLSEWRRHFMFLASEIQRCSRVDYFPPRFESCFNYGRCEFLNLCEQPVSLEEASYHGYTTKEPWDVTKEVAPEALLEGEE